MALALSMALAMALALALALALAMALAMAMAKISKLGRRRQSSLVCQGMDVLDGRGL